MSHHAYQVVAPAEISTAYDGAAVEITAAIKNTENINFFINELLLFLSVIVIGIILKILHFYLTD